MSAETRTAGRGLRATGRPTRAAGGFTLVELVSVIALVALLAGLLLPAAGGARRAMLDGRTRAQFQQWTAALEAYRAEYGRFPILHESLLVNGGAEDALEGTHLFHDVLAGRRRDGQPLGTGAAARQNPRGIAFHRFGSEEFAGAGAAQPHLLGDASGGTEIAVLVDRNLDGRVSVGEGGDYASLPAVGGLGLPDEFFPAEGVAAGVVFFAPAAGASAERAAFVCSWR